MASPRGATAPKNSVFSIQLVSDHMKIINLLRETQVKTWDDDTSAENRLIVMKSEEDVGNLYCFRNVN